MDLMVLLLEILLEVLVVVLGQQEVVEEEALEDNILDLLVL